MTGPINARFEHADALRSAFELPPDLMVLDPDFVVDIDQSSLTIGPGQKLFEKHRFEDGQLTSFVEAYQQQYAELGQVIHVLRVNQRELEADTEALRDKDPDAADDLEAGLDVIMLFAMQPEAQNTKSHQLQLYETHGGIVVESLISRELPHHDPEVD